MRSLPENALLGIVFLGFLAFLGIQGMSFLTSFTETPSEEAVHYQDFSQGLSEEEYGLLVFKTAGCMGCHNLEIEAMNEGAAEWQMQGGAIAPSLNNVAVRWGGNRERLTEKIVNPDASLPNSYMPSFAHLSEEDLNALVSFLLTLTGDRQPEVSYVEAPDISRFSQAQIDQGRELFQNNGCIACHTITSTNPPLSGNLLGPNLSYEGLRNRSDGWHKNHLTEPYSVYVLGGEPQTGVICGGYTTCMPSYRALSDEDLNALVAFLQSLK